LDGIRGDRDGTRETSTSSTFLLALLAWISTSSFPFALFFELALTEEMLATIVQVAQSFLKTTLRHFVSPGDICFLEGVDFTVQLSGIGKPAARASCLRRRP
jgi:hypothetical protein